MTQLICGRQSRVKFKFSDSKARDLWKPLLYVRTRSLKSSTGISFLIFFSQGFNLSSSCMTVLSFPQPLIMSPSSKNAFKGKLVARDIAVSNTLFLTMPSERMDNGRQLQLCQASWRWTKSAGNKRSAQKGIRKDLEEGRSTAWSREQFAEALPIFWKK